MPETQWFFLLTATLTAMVHSLIPQHWLPIVLVGRKEGWGLNRVLNVALTSGVAHLLFSAALGITAFAAGTRLAAAAGTTADALSHWLLIIFGAGYIAYDKISGHAHEAHGHPEHEAQEHMPHLPPSGKSARKRRRWLPWILAALVGFNPCVLAAPIMMAAMAESRRLGLVVLGVFSLVTVLTQLVTCAVGYHGMQKLHFLWLERHGGLLSGGLIAVLGLALLIFH